MTINIQLLIIDPEHDFCNSNGSLFVPGSPADMDRLSQMVNRLKSKISDIHVTLDSHHPVDIAHAIWFVDSAGNHPAPFTQIKASELKNRTWMTTKPGAHKRTLAYLESLETNGRYPHVIWPDHCLIGSEGTNVVPNLAGALAEWTARFGWVNYVTKGSNPWTEHFSAVKAEVPDPADISTQINTNFIETLEKADVILLAGEAGSHCLANTCVDIADNFSDSKFIEKLVLLTDATSPVPGFESLQVKFIDTLVKRGMKTATTVDYLK
jgi:nicotinamidase-related amidase